ncbi:MAG: isocitrate lyase/PEP mutase family protein [Dehalococcoidia bacterium]
MTSERAHMRAILAGSTCVSPASVFDPVSARAAQSLGFELAMLAGSVASATVLGAPDLVVLTLTEFVEQVRRITRVMDLPLLVDADHGYGNALNVRRCVQELESAGVSALTIEDTLLPRPFGVQGEQLISQEEALGKFRAAVDARVDPALVLLARTSALRAEGLAGCVSRISAYGETGADGVFLAGARTREEIEAIHAATHLPIVLGSASAELQDRGFLAAHGVRILLQGHAPFQAAARAVYETLKALRDGAPPAEVQARTASPALIGELTAESDYQQWVSRYLQPNGG